MSTQPDDAAGVEKLLMFDCWVSSGKLNDGFSHGDTQPPVVTVFSSSSKKLSVTTGSTVSQSPPSSRSGKKFVAELIEARQTLKFVVMLPALIQRAAHFRP